jgi:protein-S-isoprenylcysteine O-methyltransferase Ste14
MVYRPLRLHPLKAHVLLKRLQILLMVAVAYRAMREEQTLSDELPGYTDYMAQVRYRLVPGVW